jgi:hypothetical protein
MPTRVVSTPHPRRSACWLAAACIAAIGYFTLLPAAGEPGTAFLCLVCGSRGGVDAVLNVLLFAPLGVALALCGVRAPRAIVGMALLSACIEATQFVAIAGRDATLGDIVMNTTGGAIGIALVHWAPTWLRPSRRFAARACVLWSVLWLLAQAVASFALAPLLPDRPYYGQIARSFASMATFPGEVLDARTGTTAVPDRLIPETDSVRARLLAGAPISVLVVPGGDTPRLAPILRIADRDREEVALIGQDARTPVFGVRSGASLLRLRPALFAVPDAFGQTASTARRDLTPTVRLSARFGPVVHLRVEQSGSEIARDLPLVAGLGWTLVLPQQWYVEGTAVEAVITGLWLALGLVPLGFWMAWLRARARAPSRVITTVAIMLAAILVCGLVVIPRQFGLAPGSVVHWLSAIAGIGAGFAIASLTQRRSAAL